MLEVTKAEYIEEYRIKITFNNGASGVVDLKDALWGTMYEKLKDYNVFRKFEVSDVVHTIRWENDSDLAPEYLYEKMVEQNTALRIKEAPSAYNGTLGELYDGWAKHVLLLPSVVEEFHRQFCSYLVSADTLFLIRYVAGQKRGQIEPTDFGQLLRPTDNSPAWWIHYQLFSGHFRQYASFNSFIESVPSHMFQVRLPESINKAGWHVAHIFDVKDRDVHFRRWDRKELVRRFARNIHPCNYFYLPKYEWQRYGSNPTVIAFFYEQFKSIYRTIWEDFLRLVDSTPLLISVGVGEYRYAFSANKTDQCSAPGAGEDPCAELNECVAKYSHYRLCFKADVIESLGMDDRFCIVSNAGTFIMTKREFYETFPKVRESKSYWLPCGYNYPNPPRRALQFKVERFRLATQQD